MDIIESIFYHLGNNGPFLLIIESLLLLRKKEIYFNYYVIGSFLNILLNFFLKKIIKEPRPSVDKNTFELVLKEINNKKLKSILSHDVFGMPSGHAQGVIFSTTYTFLVLQNESWRIIFFYSIVSVVTLIQRVRYKFHTLKQIFVGSITGFLFSYLVYYLATQKNKGLMEEKMEEYCPI